MTPQPGSYPDLSNPVTAPAPPPISPARQLTEPLRELCALALLAGNGVFLALGFSGLFFVVNRWGADFGLRCEAVFATFVGPLSLGLPLVAMLLATHVSPMVRRTRPILITIMVELAVSAVFGAITFLGAFAHDLSSVRAIIEGTLGRAVWLAFLVLACIVFARVWLGLNPAPKPATGSYSGYGQPTYGRPYPGQPLYPHGATYQPGQAGSPTEPGDISGWPLVPPPPRPAPLVVESAGDHTMRISPLVVGDLTQKVPAPPPPASISPAAVPVAAAEPVPAVTEPAQPEHDAPADASEPAGDRPAR